MKSTQSAQVIHQAQVVQVEAGAGGAGGGGYDVGSIDWDNAFGEPDTSGVDKAVDKVLKKLNSIKDWIKENSPVITALLAGIGAGLLTFETIMNWGAITAAIGALIAPFQWLATAVSVFVGSITEGSGVLVGFQAIFGTTAGTAAFFCNNSSCSHSCTCVFISNK